ncbi:Oidioi.mRNA.OKI2018_I69.PAR.g8811.t1.cds [Oikopleura dioica]|uniref:Oidioi.mRNA.OKI2018_I69.PAR.g8811.t1.cds n=1 Tax=Oikopleura dioica TaxID=34765 RepID=A0ABN7RN37_OIKDI|nr:Oidioi.mRNA.OKI2018_I69.PAR.g8811.t1.cds [Oikopleura dioica]
MKITVFFSLFLAITAFDYREFYKKYHQEPSQLERARSISDLEDEDLERYTRDCMVFKTRSYDCTLFRTLFRDLISEHKNHPLLMSVKYAV